MSKYIQDFILYLNSKIAIENGYSDIAIALIKAGADVNIRKPNGAAVLPQGNKSTCEKLLIL